MFRKALSLTVITCFFLTTLTPYSQAHADTALNLPAPGTMIDLSPAYQPVIIKGVTVHKDNPFLFDFIVDVGQDKMSGEPLRKEGEKLIKYFLASLAIPDKDLWVNLSPYEKNRMIPDALGQTDMGRDLLEQDYILKQITASLIYPEKQLGKTFWDKVYAKAQEMYGTTQVPVNTFNKVWIMADRAEVFEHNQTAFVVDSHLKVMLEEDYLALQKHSSSVIASAAKQSFNTHSLSSQIVKAIILPELEREVNTGKNFANLRQIFNSIILSSWYKNNLKEALLNQVYANKARTNGINLNDPTIKQQIYEQYLKAYKKGVFNYIKEDVDNAGVMIPRKYFSGGLAIAGTPAADPAMTTDPATLVGLQNETLVDFATLASTQPIGTDAAMSAQIRSIVRQIENAPSGEDANRIADSYNSISSDDHKLKQIIREAVQRRVRQIKDHFNDGRLIPTRARNINPDAAMVMNPADYFARGSATFDPWVHLYDLIPNRTTASVAKLTVKPEKDGSASIELHFQGKTYDATFDSLSAGDTWQEAINKINEKYSRPDSAMAAQNNDLMGRLERNEIKSEDLGRMIADENKVIRYLETLPGNLNNRQEKSLRARKSLRASLIAALERRKSIDHRIKIRPSRGRSTQEGIQESGPDEAMTAKKIEPLTATEQEILSKVPDIQRLKGNVALERFLMDNIKTFNLNPTRVKVVDAKDQEQLIKEEATKNSKNFVRLKRILGFFSRSHREDVARSIQRTFVGTENEEDKGNYNNWAKASELKKTIMSKLQGAYKADEDVYFIPYLMGPENSEFSEVGAQLTDSRYVAINTITMAKVGEAAVDHLNNQEDPTDFVKGIHATGDLDEIFRLIKEENIDERYFAAFPDEQLILSFGSGYGGNVLLIKKFHALRIAMWHGKKNGWLAEHMFILEVEDLQGEHKGRKRYITGAFPSASGKTNTSFIKVPDALKDKYQARVIGDDIAWLRPGKDGRLYAINPEGGAFGVIYGTSEETNGNFMELLKGPTPVIYTNVAFNSKTQDVWWEDKTKGFPSLKGDGKYWEDWKGDLIINRKVTPKEIDAYAKKHESFRNRQVYASSWGPVATVLGQKLIDFRFTVLKRWPGRFVFNYLTTNDILEIKASMDVWAHKNSRATVPLSNGKASGIVSPEIDNPNGVPITAILWGGRSNQEPLIRQLPDFKSGIYDGLTMVVEATAAAAGMEGKVVADPFAQLPFFSTHETDYVSNQYNILSGLDHPPGFFHVNWFRRDENGKFMWPGFSDNFRPLLWALDRMDGKAEGVEDTIGILPTVNAINMEGMEGKVSKDTLQKLLDYDRESRKKEVDRQTNFLFELENHNTGKTLPDFIWQINAELRKKFGFNDAAMNVNADERLAREALNVAANIPLKRIDNLLDIQAELNEVLSTHGRVLIQPHPGFKEFEDVLDHRLIEAYLRNGAGPLFISSSENSQPKDVFLNIGKDAAMKAGAGKRASLVIAMATAAVAAAATWQYYRKDPVNPYGLAVTGKVNAEMTPFEIRKILKMGNNDFLKVEFFREKGKDFLYSVGWHNIPDGDIIPTGMPLSFRFFGPNQNRLRADFKQSGILADAAMSVKDNSANYTLMSLPLPSAAIEDNNEVNKGALQVFNNLGALRNAVASNTINPDKDKVVLETLTRDGSPYRKPMNILVRDYLNVGKSTDFGTNIRGIHVKVDKTSLAQSPGGIDLNTFGMQWKVSKDGSGVEMTIDPAMIERIRHMGIDSLSPVIFRITPVTSIWPLVGLQAPVRAERLAAV